MLGKVEECDNCAFGNARKTLWKKTTAGEWLFMFVSLNGRELVNCKSGPWSLIFAQIIVGVIINKMSKWKEDFKTKAMLLREMKKLKECFNPDSSRTVDASKSGRDIILDQADIAWMKLDGQKAITDCHEVICYHDLNSRTKYGEVFHKEFKEKSLRGVCLHLNI
jgi:hypothetical protein